MKKYLEPAKEIDVYGEFDVVVVGGGVAGWSAAVAAGRQGAKALIIERFPFFGGTATASLMANIVGYRNQVKPDDIQTTKGLGEEIILRLLEINGAEKSRNAYESEKRSDTKGDLSYNFAFVSKSPPKTAPNARDVVIMIATLVGFYSSNCAPIPRRQVHLAGYGQVRDSDCRTTLHPGRFGVRGACR
ncbi:MAG: FAD-dependent oxidoreductase [Oscillospiraceae bacterium]|jgi:glycine/D-amino acid oxidase-like deaminating enzyme|nr:FAD-dependent oxidoreductase [Oscillospiraceae bacterium]